MHMEDLKAQMFKDVEEGIIYIKEKGPKDFNAIATAIMLYDLKRAMLEAEQFEDLAVFRKLEIKHGFDIKV